MTKILLPTTNPAKYARLADLLAEGGVELRKDPRPLTEVQSADGDRVAAAKAEEAFRRYGRPVLVDDFGLEMDAWNGFPGSLVKPLLETAGLDGLRRLAGGREAKGRLVCRLAYKNSAAAAPEIFHGVLRGTLDATRTAPAGDPTPISWLFVPEGQDSSLAEAYAGRPDFPDHRRAAFRSFLAAAGAFGRAAPILNSEGMLDSARLLDPEGLASGWLRILGEVLGQGVFVDLPDESYVEVMNHQFTYSAYGPLEPAIQPHVDARMCSEMRKVYLSEEPNALGHSYRGLIFAPSAGADQVASVVNYLRKSPAGRAAVVTLYRPWSKDPAVRTKQPCVNVLHFIAREGRLNLHVFARAQDAFNKFIPDYLAIQEIFLGVCSALGATPGKTVATVSSLHIYRQDIEKAREILRLLA